LDQVVAELPEIPLDPARAPDDDVVRARHPSLRQQLARESAEAALHSVADHSAADLPGDGKADTHGGVAVAARADEEDEAGGRSPLAAIGGEEIGAAGEGGQADSVLRPRLRRAARTLRPPTVADRARKPWRRLRTRLLGWKVRFIAHPRSLN
jgi:hypothetical protein